MRNPNFIYFTLVLFILLHSSLAQFPVEPKGLKTVTSKVNDQVTISYKETKVCETTTGVKSYSGFVHLPGTLLPDTGGYDINTFFIYFSARHNASTAPLAIYLAGGPGESSTYTALSSESGPCYVNVHGNETTLNPWSFNNHVNMLYIDQPVQAGFSYDKLVNATFDVMSQIITPEDFSNQAVPPSNVSFGVGIFPSQDPARTTNTTVTSAKALWHFTEHWLSSFPEYTTTSNKLSIWGNSYGGFWVPEISVQVFNRLKKLPKNHELKAKNITVDTVGITNGCVDMLEGMEGYLQFAYNNTYGVQFITEEVYNEAMHNLTKPDGCNDLIKSCRATGRIGDPDFTGNNITVNEVCNTALQYCNEVMGILHVFNNVTAFDVAIQTPDPCPFYVSVAEYLNRAGVQDGLGVPLNFTYVSSIVTAVFSLTPYEQIVGTGDLYRQNGSPLLEMLLENGVKVVFVFGDRDYRCPWTGGEATAKALKWKNQKGFLDAGYKELEGITEGARQAVVKQYGQLSFSRVLNAGHGVSAYAPEAVYQIFERSIFGKDIVTGKVDIGPNFKTDGPKDSWGWKNKLPDQSPKSCMVAGSFLKENPWEGFM